MMEEGILGKSFSDCCKARRVVILVMMEEGILAAGSKSIDCINASRNPCYDGRGCFIRDLLNFSLLGAGRNPCYDGRGCFIASLSAAKQEEAKVVILVMMEEGVLWGITL